MYHMSVFIRKMRNAYDYLFNVCKYNALYKS